MFGGEAFYAHLPHELVIGNVDAFAADIRRTLNDHPVGGGARNSRHQGGAQDDGQTDVRNTTELHDVPVAVVVNVTGANASVSRAASLRRSESCVSPRHPLVPGHELESEPVVIDA